MKLKKKIISKFELFIEQIYIYIYFVLSLLQFNQIMIKLLIFEIFNTSF